MSETLDPSKYHIIAGKKKRNLILISALFCLLVIPSLLILYYQIGINRPSQTDKETTFEIKRGDSPFDVAEGLYQKDAINSKFLFLTYIFINGLDKNIQAGVYTIKAGSTVVGITEQFMHGKNDVKVTFLEGWRVEEFTREAESLLSGINYNKFVTAAKPYEGYLFPDTYFLNRDISLEELISLLRTTFDNKTSEILTEENLKKVGLTKEQVVILASIVEKEAGTSKVSDLDRQLIAGILLKRFKEEMKLDADATVQYAVAFIKSCGSVDSCSVNALVKSEKDIDWWPNPLTQEDINIDSPYNTRKNLGFPPTPISSVSLSSLEAVINAKTSDYYYYLHDLEGNTHYARTLDEHNFNIQKYLTK
jgi:UPF0755 protein